MYPFQLKKCLFCVNLKTGTVLLGFVVLLLSLLGFVIEVFSLSNAQSIDLEFIIFLPILGFAAVLYVSLFVILGVRRNISVLLLPWIALNVGILVIDVLIVAYIVVALLILPGHTEEGYYSFMSCLLISFLAGFGILFYFLLIVISCYVEIQQSP
ncbi:hypothetical protein ACFFRR_002890 [Megaselia abdita]